MSAPRAAVAAALVVAIFSACGDDPFAFHWNDIPDTVQLYSLARPELNLLSGYSFFDGVAYRVEQANSGGKWDIAVDTRGQNLVLLPPGALGVSGRARIGVIEGVPFADLVEAPEDTAAYEGALPVPVRTGSVYVIKTNSRRGSFGSTCVYYAKLEPVLVDVSQGSLMFHYVSSPICNSRDLTPPD
ncbi:MAG: hypothetical protein VX801_00595 [Gemmatimonadota bacterium]|nr:hypothetical protein [Gemmatimonadota bacterium]